MKVERSADLLNRAQAVIPGGVNSPVRAFRAVGGTPLFISRARGAHMWDVDGNRYVDYVGSWGPMILGHAETSVVEAAKTAIERSSSFGAPTEGADAVQTALSKLTREVGQQGVSWRTHRSGGAAVDDPRAVPCLGRVARKSRPSTRPPLHEQQRPPRSLAAPPRKSVQQCTHSGSGSTRSSSTSATF